MRTLLKIKLIIFLAFVCSLQANDKKPLTLEDIYDSDKFTGKTIENIEWQPDGSAFTFTKRNEETDQLDIYSHEVKSGKERIPPWPEPSWVWKVFCTAR